MESFDVWFGRVANGLTILAAITAFAGVIWAFRSRAKLGVRPMFSPGLVPHLTLIVTSDGSNPVRNLELIAATLTPQGFAMSGGNVAEQTELGGGETLLVQTFDPELLRLPERRRFNEHRWEIDVDEGFYLQAQWQSPLRPWRKKSRTYAWTASRRLRGEGPKVLRGRSEREFLKRAQDPSLNPTLLTYAAPPRMAATIADDETFDSLISAHRGVTVVGFGPAWQGEHWSIVRRLLDVFAERHGKCVQVLVVNIDESPSVSSRFDMNVVPTFKAFRNGEVIAERDGVASYQDLEDAFSSYLS